MRLIYLRFFYILFIHLFNFNELRFKRWNSKITAVIFIKKYAS